ncbi:MULTISPECIES: hypothetical protein [unclassified Haloarcula]|jgi:hypothetical protein|uniref:hypothetical protein n=1 Tax=Haloarcula sp. K1 TaxID=1622207 RepID=UPI0007BB96C4|nr:hypothetical protein [Haloarcula sp. K1]KZX46222.1 hypothetical protein AV929_15730 [Haloarcula sp. K1]
MNSTTDNDSPVDCTPEGDKQNAALPSGEVFDEYGVVDLNRSFPSERKEWHPELGPAEDHVVVPFRVVARGFRSQRAAEANAERHEEENGGTFRAVRLNDTRGL